MRLFVTQSMPISGSNDWDKPYLNENIGILATPFLLNNVFSIDGVFLFDINKLTSICHNVQMKHIGSAVVPAVNLHLVQG